MPIAQHVLFPVDLGPASARMAPAVAAVARRLAAPVTLLHLVSGADSGIAAAALHAFETAHFADGLTVTRRV